MRPVHYLSLFAGLALAGFGTFVLGAIVSSFAMASSGGLAGISQMKIVLAAAGLSIVAGSGFLYFAVKAMAARDFGAASRIVRFFLALFVCGFVYDLIKVPDSLKIVGCLAVLMLAVLVPVRARRAGTAGAGES